MAESPGALTSVVDWLAAAKAAERSGEFFRAYDVARHGLEQFPNDLLLKHRAVLALARSGATAQAKQLFRLLGLEGSEDQEIAALGARLAKDEALGLPLGAERTRRLAAAATMYERIYTRNGHYFPGINTANLRLLSGDPQWAGTIAASLARTLEAMTPPSDDELFWVLATLVEAHVIRGDLEAANKVLPAALAASKGNYALLSTAARSIFRAAEAKGLPMDWLAPFTPPTVIHYLGHIIAPPGKSGRFPAEAEASVAAEIAKLLEARRVGFGFGALAAGADILFAEALLQRGGQLHVILPFQRDEFVDQSVRPAGENWVGRFKDCMAQAKSVRYATEDAYLGDDTLYVYGSRLAMGLAVLAGQHLFAGVEQIAVWDGGPARGVAGTAIDIGIWRDTGRKSTVIPVAPSAPVPSAAVPSPVQASNHRRARAMLFGDLKGFSKLTDRELPGYVAGVLGEIQRVRARHSDTVLLANTWGDGLFLVFQRAHEAAALALDLQDALGKLDFAAFGLGAPLVLRLGGHVGPVYETEDPILGRRNFFGAHVSRAARIEPVTPPGCVYVTETFAAALALEHSDRFACDYVGVTEAAKGYGSMRMFLLHPAGGSPGGSSFPMAL
jgi:class 3 adenylate cyclase